MRDDVRKQMEQLNQLLKQASEQEENSLVQIVQTTNNTMANAMLQQHLESMRAMERVIASQDSLIREVMSQRLAVVAPPAAKLHATLSRGRASSGRAQAHAETSGGAGAGAAFDDDDPRTAGADEMETELVADLNPLGPARGVGHGFVP